MFTVDIPVGGLRRRDAKNGLDGAAAADAAQCTGPGRQAALGLEHAHCEAPRVRQPQRGGGARARRAFLAVGAVAGGSFADLG